MATKALDKSNCLSNHWVQSGYESLPSMKNDQDYTLNGERLSYSPFNEKVIQAVQTSLGDVKTTERITPNH
jgi:hypothetical protein